MNFCGFVLVFRAFSGGWILGFRFDPSRDPYGNLERLGLESTGAETAHSIRCLLLHGGGNMGVCVQGKTRRVVSQHSGEGFYVYTILQGQNRECKPQVMESDSFQSSPFQHPLEHVQDAVRGHRASERGGYILVFLLHAVEDFDGIRSYRNIAVGIFRFQRGLHHLTVLTEDLSSDIKDATFYTCDLPRHAGGQTGPAAVHAAL